MRRLFAIILAAGVVALTLAAIAQASTASTPGTHYLTLVGGADFHSLDSRTLLRFATNTGGGIYASGYPTTDLSFVEAGVTLPDGATVTEITLYARSCKSPETANSYYFGAYTPSTGSFAYIIPSFLVPMSSCAQTQAIVKPVNPPVVVDNSLKRYVIGMHFYVQYFHDTYDPNFVAEVLVGARVTYQMPGAFLPAVQR